MKLTLSIHQLTLPLVPSPVAYGSRGSRLFEIPPNTKLFWTVKLVRLNFVGEGEDRSAIYR